MYALHVTLENHIKWTAFIYAGGYYITFFADKSGPVLIAPDYCVRRILSFLALAHTIVFIQVVAFTLYAWANGGRDLAGILLG